MISGEWLAEDATVLRYGLRRLLLSLPIVVVCLGGGWTGLWFAFRDDGIGAGWIPLAMLMAMGVGGLILFVTRWRARRWVTAFDSTGFWWMRGKEAALIRWDSLAGAGMYWARTSNRAVFTVELCPHGEMDRDDPLLWKFVRDTEPLRPGLPRLRYRIDVGDSHKAYEKAFVRWAPELWFGRKEQPMSYPGQPDETGHRERTAERSDTVAHAPLVFDAVGIGDTVVVQRGMILVYRRLGVALALVALCGWAVWALVPEHGHGAGAVVRQVIAAVLVLSAQLGPGDDRAGRPDGLRPPRHHGRRRGPHRPERAVRDAPVGLAGWRRHLRGSAVAHPGTLPEGRDRPRRPAAVAVGARHRAAAAGAAPAASSGLHLARRGPARGGGGLPAVGAAHLVRR
ncbi:hypothetical protein ACFQ51_14260 [Streptomyces kaempferi]